MPFSSDVFTHYMSEVIRLLRPSRFLDVGAGAGKYGKLIGEISQREGFPVHDSWGIEIDYEYILRYKLREVYTSVSHGDAFDVLQQHPRLRYDLVLMGDVVEHLPKSRGIDLINFLLYRSGYIAVIYPEDYQQDDWEGHSAEAHISMWSPHDFAGMNVIHKQWEGMSLYLIKGLQPTNFVFTD